MPKDKTENHEKIMAAARAEFLKRGYIDASMRRIAADAGMSVAGLYKHFKSKEEMFSALVEPAYSGLMAMFRRVTDEMCEQVKTADLSNLWDDTQENLMMMRYIYDHFDAFKLLICRAQGTRYENILHDIAVMEEKATLFYLEKLQQRGKKVLPVREKEFHLLVTANFQSIFQAVEHDFTLEEALHYALTLDGFFTKGWKNLFGV